MHRSAEEPLEQTVAPTRFPPAAGGAPSSPPPVVWPRTGVRQDRRRAWRARSLRQEPRQSRVSPAPFRDPEIVPASAEPEGPVAGPSTLRPSPRPSPPDFVPAQTSSRYASVPLDIYPRPGILPALAAARARAGADQPMGFLGKLFRRRGEDAGQAGPFGEPSETRRRGFGGLWRRQRSQSAAPAAPSAPTSVPAPVDRPPPPSQRASSRPALFPPIQEARPPPPGPPTVSTTSTTAGRPAPPPAPRLAAMPVRAPPVRTLPPATLDTPAGVRQASRPAPRDDQTVEALGGLISSFLEHLLGDVGAPGNGGAAAGPSSDAVPRAPVGTVATAPDGTRTYQVEQRSQGVTMTVRATTTQAPGGASAPRPAADTASSSHMGSADRPPSFSTSFPLTPSPFTPSNPVFRLRSATAQGSAAGAADEAPGPSGVVGSPTGAAGPSAARTGPRHPYRPDVGSQATPPTLAIGQLIEFFSRLSSLGDSAPNTRGMVGYRTQRPGLSDFNQAGLGGQPRSLNPAVLDDFGGLFGEGGRLMSAAEEMRRLTELLMGGSRGTPARFIDSLPKWTHRAREKRASEEEDEQVCVVCLGEFEGGEEVRMLPCMHKFHAGCVDRWLEQNRACPVCKHDVMASFQTPDDAFDDDDND